MSAETPPPVSEGWPTLEEIAFTRKCQVPQTIAVNAALCNAADWAVTKYPMLRALAGEHRVDGLLVDGCFSGDCPHDTFAECSIHIATEYRLLVEALNAILTEEPQ